MLTEIIKKRKPRQKVVDAAQSSDFFAQVQKKAYELFEKRGSVPGFEEQDWYEAEQLVRNEMKH